MTHTIRKATKRDHPALLTLLADVLDPLDHRSVLKDEWWLAFAGAVPVAFACAAPAGASWPNAAFMALSGVTKAHRGHGLQKRLLRVREAWARSVGYTVAITYTAHSNNASSNSLISAGYKLYRPASEWGMDHALYWRKNLDATR
jgi:GNAT superfamily N-acetyltransferase